MPTPPVETEDRAGFLHDPIGYMARVYRRHGRAVTAAPGRDDFVFAFGPEHNKAILLQPDLFAATGFLFPGPKNSAQRRLLAGLFNLNGERHLDHRRVLWPTFQRLTALGYRDAVADTAGECLSAWRFGEVRDVSAEMLALVARLNGRLLLGVAADDLVRQLESATEEWMALNTPLTVAASLSLDLPRAVYEQALACSERVEMLTKQLLEIRKASPAGGTDLLGQLLQAHARAPQRVTAAEVVGQAAHIFAASNQSTRSALIWTLFLLSQHPGVTADLYAELRGALGGEAPTLEQMERLPLLERVIKESLRLFPPVAYYTRATAGPVELGGRRLRGGTTVVFSHYVTHHMPDLFPAPERFDPERWHTAAPTPYEYLPYGIGPRMCIGVTYASLVLRVVLPLVVQRFRLSAAPGARVDRRVTTILSPRHPVPMRIDRPGPPFVAVPVAGDVHEMVHLPAAAAAQAA
ncbi:MAG TPA: cytochrome P450 [Gemmataceae bacterium]|nr:cytochrome P450 [Gemmataceae bacterium]